MSFKFKIGDEVKLISDTLAGVITKINNNLVTFKSSDGFHYTYPANELISSFTFDHLIDQTDIPIKKILEKEKTTPAKKYRKKEKTSFLEVDLHIQHLVESERYLSNYEMMEIQLNEVHQKINYAIKQKIQKVVFIHGVGQGVLRAELRKVLKDYPVSIFDASFSKYGQGATEVFVYQNKKN